MTVHRLVLWDIDHTLVDLAGIGRSWYESALRAMDVELHTHPVYAGRTERAISTDALLAHGIEPSEDNIRTLWTYLIQLSEGSRDSLADVGRALDGSATIIAELDRLGVAQTVVTGNLPEISRHKLIAFGLEQHLDLEIGGYGTISDDRSALVTHAINAASAKYGMFTPDQVVVVGDTPNDVRAATENGAVAVAVATGHYGVEELTAAGATVVLADLADLDAARNAILQ
ncbi:HAD family hydrolase [Microlunatus soli]|uniref:Phosphoglycolate phosphatase, HAD superfamily n=1 Tax=Microlunatus soli TaxID=630515 RepID=A0A1H1MPK6_9ACTN|nr:HAD family hydrolase [Microlunatus soli]SDR88773.1 Phosphoglycolate phosphatase, HAD superfamily [Microlunatus soli]